MEILDMKTNGNNLGTNYKKEKSQVSNYQILSSSLYPDPGSNRDGSESTGV